MRVEIFIKPGYTFRVYDDVESVEAARSRPRRVDALKAGHGMRRAGRGLASPPASCRFMAWPSSPGTLHRSIRRASARTPGNGCAPGRFTAWKSGYPMACRVDLFPASRSSAL